MAKPREEAVAELPPPPPQPGIFNVVRGTFFFCLFTVLLVIVLRITDPPLPFCKYVADDARCRPCPANAFCGSSFEFTCTTGFVASRGACVEDKAIEILAVSVSAILLDLLRTRRGLYECDMIASPLVREGVLEQEALRSVTGDTDQFAAMYRRALILLGDRDDVDIEAAGDEERLFVAADGAKPLMCVVRLFLLEHMLEAAAVLAVFLSTVYALRRQRLNKKKEAAFRRLLDEVIQALIEHRFDPNQTGSGELAVDHLRDHFLSNFKGPRKRQLWKQVVDFVESDSDTRIKHGFTILREGEELAAWKWAADAPTSPRPLKR